MSTPARGRRRTDPERFDAYTRWSLYLLVASAAFVPLLAVGSGADQRGGDSSSSLAIYAAGTLVQIVLAIGVTSKSITRYLGGPEVPRRWLVSLAGTTAALTTVAMVALPDGDGLSGRAGALVLTLGLPVVALAPLLPPAAIALASLGVSGITAAVSASGGSAPPGPPAG
ncbi:hypothetical protein [Cellulomonas fimi]|uniref:Uncharacterized protein n=1 Tax=Cellulomonas fimi TaxID=1708 RepID=A0A7Y0QHL1_CELFI|nr:hypothetical protein [Cellulomonas fimi]NMR20400.1 hypothetical protein [Cellulomonas fimi]